MAMAVSSAPAKRAAKKAPAKKAPAKKAAAKKAPPKRRTVAQVEKELAELKDKVVAQTIKYAHSNGSCRSGTVEFISDALGMDYDDADALFGTKTQKSFDLTIRFTTDYRHTEEPHVDQIGLDAIDAIICDLGFDTYAYTGVTGVLDFEVIDNTKA